MNIKNSDLFFMPTDSLKMEQKLQQETREYQVVWGMVDTENLAYGVPRTAVELKQAAARMLQLERYIAQLEDELWEYRKDAEIILTDRRGKA